MKLSQLYLCYLLTGRRDMSRYLSTKLRFFVRIVSGVMLLVAAGSTLRAQSSQGTFVGTVRASSGIGLPGATVTVRNPSLGHERTTTTLPDGTYSFDDLPPSDTYELQADLNGFVSVLQSAIPLVAAQRMTVDFLLYASTSEALVVTGRVATFEHERSTVQQLVSETMTHSLPLFGRDFLAMSSLMAGFSGAPTAPSPLGQIYWSNNVLVDGTSHYSKWRGAPRTFASGYALDSIREVQVLASQFSAEFGEALAAVTVAVTNSGTNALHGSAFLFAQDDALNDVPVFLPDKAPYSSQRFGSSFGGPVVKDRTHFFLSYEGLRTRGSNIVTSPAASNALARDDQDQHVMFAKVDHKSTERDLVTARYNGQWFRWHDEPGVYTLPGSGTQYTNDAHTFLLSDTALVSTRLLNQLRFQFARYEDIRHDLQPSLYINRSGYSVEGGLLGPFGFGVSPEDTWEAADIISYRRANHGYKVGGGVKYVRAHNETLSAGRGAYYFAGAPDVAPAPFAFVQALGDVAAATADPRSFSFYGFAQDDWALTSNVSLNIGVRYDVERISNLAHYDAPTDIDNVQPRLGFAWQAVPGRTVVRGGVGLYTQQHILSSVNRVELEGADGTILLSLAPGSSVMPTFPNRLPPTLPVLPPRDIVVLDPAFKNPYSMQATVGTEHSLRGLVVGADFVYLRGRDLMSLVDTNAPASNIKPAERSVEEADATRPIVPGPDGFRKIVALGNEGQSWYRAMQIKVNRSTGPVHAMIAYTLAEAEDQANYLLPEDSLNLDAEKARADNDIRHNLSVGLIWVLPGGRRGLNGLTLSSFSVFRSSRPYTETWGDDRNGTSQNDARPQGRNTRQGDTYRSVDVSLAKLFHAGKTSVEARIEAFNLLSTTNYDEYDGVLSSAFYGRPVSAFPRRRLQLAAIVKF